MSKKCRNKGVSYFFCLVIDGSVVDPDPDPYWSPTANSGSGSVKNEYGSTTLIDGSGSIPLTSGSGSLWPKNM